MLTPDEVDANKDYPVSEVAKILDLSHQHVLRLVYAGHFPGTYQKAPVPGSPHRIPGKAVIDFMEKRKL